MIVVDANVLVYAHVASYQQHDAAREWLEPLPEAWTQVESWLDADATWTPVPTPRHRGILGTCMASPGLRANDVPDAHLAALAIEHGVSLATSDAGFARFEKLSCFDPLRP